LARRIETAPEPARQRRHRVGTGTASTNIGAFNANALNERGPSRKIGPGTFQTVCS
jgi:hypothetical protein